MATHISTPLFASVLRRLRRKSGLTQGQLAEKASCDDSYISYLECEKRGPSLEMVLKISYALDYPAWKLVREVERKLPES